MAKVYRPEAYHNLRSNQLRGYPNRWKDEVHLVHWWARALFALKKNPYEGNKLSKKPAHQKQLAMWRKRMVTPQGALRVICEGWQLHRYDLLTLTNLAGASY